MDNQLSGVVVAGGKSVRLGQDKRRLRLWGPQGPTLLEHTITILQAVCSEVLVVLNDAAAWPELTVPLVPDRFPNGGSLGGIATGLGASAQPYSLVVAADMPLLHLGVLEWMAAQPRDYDILAPRTSHDTKSGGWEPLCAIYSRRALPIMEAQLQQGQLKLRTVYDQLAVAAILPPQLAALDPAGQAFQNINTPEDLAHVQAVLGIAPIDTAE